MEASWASMLLLARHTYSPESATDMRCSRRREPWAWRGRGRRRRGVEGPRSHQLAQASFQASLVRLAEATLRQPRARGRAAPGLPASASLPVLCPLGLSLQCLPQQVGVLASLSQLHSIPGVGQEGCPHACTT